MAITDIKATLDIILNAKKRDSVATHNPRGEYGDRHHKMASRFVISIFRKQSVKCELFYIGIYDKPHYQENSNGTVHCRRMLLTSKSEKCSLSMQVRPVRENPVNTCFIIRAV